MSTYLLAGKTTELDQGWSCRWRRDEGRREKRACAYRGIWTSRKLSFPEMNRCRWVNLAEPGPSI
jgi:hypothetical protein